MVADSERQNGESPRWGYLLLAVLILVLTGALFAGLSQLPRLIPQLAGPTAVLVTPATARPAVLQPTIPPTPTPTNPPPTLTPTPWPTIPTPTSPPPTATLTPTPGVTQPTIDGVMAGVDEEAGTITFHLEAAVPADRHVDEVLLWYDTEAGHRLQRFDGLLPPDFTLSYELDAVQEGLTTTLAVDGLRPGALDYWWLVRDTAGETDRAGGAVALGPALEALVATPAPEPPPIDFTWAVSESQHYLFHFVPGTAAERDLALIGSLAETALARTSAVLDAELDGQMGVYLVPRLFWQGGATYGGKVQLVSYLDRNYTGIETWSYFGHEGTHALAQDILQPKENGGGPDGVLVEGLAVWATDGHYRREPIDAWTAVVAASDQFIPLAELRAGPFYDFQHEVSYLEGASFVKFLIERDGMAKLKELYGLATGDADHDEALVTRLYGTGYEDLEAAWLDHLAGQEPTPEQAETWRLTVRFFDLMRRYQTELDPDARILPSDPPPEWTTDTLKIFLHRVDAPLNVVLEIALFAAQNRLRSGDLQGAAGLLDDVEATLDAGGALDRPALIARQEILDLVAAQDRAVLRADAGAYLDTLAPASTLALDTAVEEALRPPFTDYRQEVVRLAVPDDGGSAEGVVLLHAQVADGAFAEDGQGIAGAGQRFAEDGQIFAVAFTRVGDRWLMTHREPREPAPP